MARVKIIVAHVPTILLIAHMAKRLSPTLNVTIDPDIKEELMRRKRDEALNISAFVNNALRPLFKKKTVRTAGK